MARAVDARCDACRDPTRAVGGLLSAFVVAAEGAGGAGHGLRLQDNGPGFAAAAPKQWSVASARPRLQTNRVRSNAESSPVPCRPGLPPLRPPGQTRPLGRALPAPRPPSTASTTPTTGSVIVSAADLVSTAQPLSCKARRRRLVRPTQRPTTTATTATTTTASTRRAHHAPNARFHVETHPARCRQHLLHSTYVRCWVLDAGCWMLGAGRWMADGTALNAYSLL